MNRGYLIEGQNSRGNFILRQVEGQELGQLMYPKWYSQRAEFRLMGDTYRVQPKSFWGNRHLVFREGEQLGEIHFDWRGRVHIHLTDIHKAFSFVLRRRGAFKIRYELGTPGGQILAVLRSKFIWKKLTYDVTVDWLTEGADDRSQSLLIMVCGFCLRVMRQRNNSSG